MLNDHMVLIGLDLLSFFLFRRSVKNYRPILLQRKRNRVCNDSPFSAPSRGVFVKEHLWLYFPHLRLRGQPEPVQRSTFSPCCPSSTRHASGARWRPRVQNAPISVHHPVGLALPHVHPQCGMCCRDSHLALGKFNTFLLVTNHWPTAYSSANWWPLSL